MDNYAKNILGAFLLDENYCKSFIDAFKEQKFFETDIKLNTIFELIYAFVKQYNKIPTIDILYEELKYLENNNQLGEFKPNFIYSIKLLEDSYDRDLYTDIAKDLLKSIVLEDIGDESIIAHVDTYKKLEALNTRVSIKTAFNGGYRSNLSLIKRESLGISFIDASTGGGLLPGETCGFLIPTKSGKTTLVYQGSQACVLRHKHCIAFTFEQAFEGNIANRIYCLASQSTLYDWKDPDNMDPDIIKRLEESQSLWDKYFRIVDDWTDPQKSIKDISEIFNIVGDRNKELPEGETVDSIFIDWWGALKYKLILANTHTKGEAHARVLVQTWLQSVKTYAEKHHVKVYVFHQVAGSKAGQKKVATVHDGQEDKNWPQFFDFCMVSSKKDEYGIVTFDMQASRSSEGGIFKQYLDGNACLFRDAEAYDMETSKMIEKDGEKENDNAFDIYNL